MFQLILRQKVFVAMALNVSANISRIASVAFVLLFLFEITRGETEPNASPPPSCNPLLAIDCNFYYEDFVWSLNPDNDLCIPLVNRCVFNNINCQRYRNQKPLYKEVTKSDCQQKCPTICTAANQEKVCAERDSKNCYFKSQCELNRYICENAEMWWQTGSQNCQNVTSDICP